MALHENAQLEPKSYRLPNLEVVRTVFDAAFASATMVRGAFGWFDAGWIGILAYGLAEYLEKENAEPIELTISPALFSAEREALEAALTENATQHEDALAAVISELDRGASAWSTPVTRYAVHALSWMVVNDKLRINVAFPRRSSSYHPKVWVFEDGEDAVVIRGSANATRRGIGAGIEHLDLDCSWRDRYRVEEYRRMVLDWAQGRDDMLLQTVPLDLDLLKSRVQTVAEEQDLDLLRRPTRGALDEALASEEGPVYSGKGPTFRIPPEIEWERGRFAHQAEAVHAWEQAGRQGILAIATGGGKTVAAAIGAQRSWHEQVEEGPRGPLIILISAPTKVLLRQWDHAMREFGLEPYTPTLERKAHRQESLGNLMTTLGTENASDVVAIIVTNSRLCEPGFHRTLKMGLRRASRAGKDPYVLHIGDEAHTLGARGFIENIPDFVEERLGLSATPIRQFDDEGSEGLLSYFGGSQLEKSEDAIVYKFGLSDAIGCGALVPYEYHVEIVELDDEEMEEYRDFTQRIGAKIGAAGGLDTGDESLTALLMARRSILETAVAKLGFLRKLLATIDVSRMLLYTSSKNPEQFEAAHDILHEKGVRHRQVTQELTANEGELVQVLRDFAEGEVDCLIAKKVLDEGLDVPGTKTAVLLASSTTEREWIQRLGRILRKAEGKRKAAIYDVMALPSAWGDVKDEKTTRHLILGELTRVRRIAEGAANQDDVLEQVWAVEREYLNGGAL